MSNVISPLPVITLERPSLSDRVRQILYLLTLTLAFTTLWAMAETGSLEAQTKRSLPALKITPDTRQALAQ